MAELDKVTNHLNDCLEASRRDNGWCFVRKDIVEDALSIIEEQRKQIEAMNFIYGFVYGGEVKEIKKLVRCGECKHRDPEDHRCDCGGMMNLIHYVPVPDDWFCADGEVKEE